MTKSQTLYRPKHNIMLVDLHLEEHGRVLLLIFSFLLAEDILYFESEWTLEVWFAFKKWESGFPARSWNLGTRCA